MTINQIRIANNRAIRRYEMFGTKLFRRALEEQAINPNPLIMNQAYIEFYQYVFVDSASREYNSIRKREMATKAAIDSFFLSTWREWIKQWVNNNMLEVIAGVNTRTFEKIREITAQGIEDGLNPSQLAKQLKKLIGSKARALAIAKTEGTAANNMGTERSAEDWQIQTGTRLYKIWIHSGNNKEPRISHLLAEGKPIPKEERFIIDDARMLYPGDKSAPVGQLVNCLCTTVYLSERLARKRYPDSF
tara:strand:+ start:26366 stop:27106 length:741 start_codon:yes stop_codon:yes gene_type:complete